MVVSPSLLPPASCCTAQEEKQGVNSPLDLAKRSIGDPERIAASHGETESIEAAEDATESVVRVRGKEGSGRGL